MPRLIAAFFVLNTVVVIGMLLSRDQITTNYVDDIWPVIFPAAALVAILMAYRFVRQGREFAAFLGSAATIALLVISGAVGMFPNLIVSTTDRAYNLTIYNAAVGGQHARRLPDLRRDRDPVHPGLHRRRVLLLPRQDHGRLARLLRPSRGRSPDPADGSHAAVSARPETRLLALDRAAGRLLATGVAVAVGAAIASMAFAIVLALAIAGTAGVAGPGTGDQAPDTGVAAGRPRRGSSCSAACSAARARPWRGGRPSTWSGPSGSG